MGVVYQAFDPLIEREVAIKVLSPEVARTPSALQRFLGEARSIGRLNHPHVVSIYEINEANGIYYIVMELLNGGSVEDLAARTGLLPWQDACRITADAARGLAAAHAAGLVHRDVKPANLMLTASGTVKVVDFGLSKLQDADHSLSDAITRAGQLLGTPHFMSPEQFDGVAVDASTDTYGLGATLFRLLTGRFPFQDSGSIMQLMKAHLLQPVPNASGLVAEIPAECDRMIATAMSKLPADRYRSCNDFASDLESLLARTLVPVEVEPATATKQNSIHGRALSFALVVEPSRLQSTMRKDALTQVGVDTVKVVRSIEEAMSLFRQQTPDLIWTSMELLDGRGLDWLRSLGAQGLLHRSTVVLNSSDVTITELASIGKSGSVILAPRTARLESVLHVAHGAGPVRFPADSITKAIDRDSPIRVISDTGRIPAALSQMCRQLHLSNVEILSPARPGNQATHLPGLTILIRTASTLPGDAAAYAAMVSVRRAELSAAVQAETSGHLLLRAVGHGGVTALVRRTLSVSSLESLLQAGRW
jgi:serine/threonine protein kinase